MFNADVFGFYDTVKINFPLYPSIRGFLLFEFNYSDLNESIGFDLAAINAWKPTVSSDIIKAAMPATKKTQI
jgi:hypothetical protein